MTEVELAMSVTKVILMAIAELLVVFMLTRLVVVMLISGHLCWKTGLLVVFYVANEEDVILDCEYFFDLVIIINNDGGVDRGDVIYQGGLKMVMMMKSVVK
jgi:hypothetical protein